MSKKKGHIRVGRDRAEHVADMARGNYATIVAYGDGHQVQRANEKYKRIRTKQCKLPTMVLLNNQLYEMATKLRGG